MISELLASPSRCILLELTDELYRGPTLYYATSEYSRASTDDQPSRPYLPLLSPSITIRDAIDINNESVTCKIINDKAQQDITQTDVNVWWAKVLIGDVTWPRTDFIQMFFGRVNVSDVSVSDDYYSMKIVSDTSFLDVAVSELTVYGKVYNYELQPVSDRVYKCGSTTGTVTAVRDNGVLVSYSQNGDTITLNQASYGVVTASIQHSDNSLHTVLEQIVLQSVTYNVTDNPTVGYVLKAGDNKLQAIVKLCASIGAYFRYDAANNQRVVRRLDNPDLVTAISPILADSYYKNTYHYLTKQPYCRSVIVNYRPNFRVLTDSELASTADRYLLEPHLTTAVTYDTSSGDSDEDVVQPPVLMFFTSINKDVEVDTYFYDVSDADVEKTRRFAIRSKTRFLDSASFTPIMGLPKVGNAYQTTIDGQTVSCVVVSYEYDIGTLKNKVILWR